jgi:hypothetical protein
MAATAVAELIVEAPLEQAFARFIDFSRWDLWMPKLFRPLSGPARELREGDRLSVGLGPAGKLVTELTVLRLRKHKEICWRGGLRGFLQGEHSFFFSDAPNLPGKTCLRSEEPFSGLLVHGLLGRRIERDATQAANEILSGFAGHLALTH